MDSNLILPEYMHLLPAEYIALAVPLWQLEERYRFSGRMHADALYPFFFTADDASRLLHDLQDGGTDVLLTCLSVMLFTEKTGWEYEELSSPGRKCEYRLEIGAGPIPPAEELHRVSLEQGSARLGGAIAAFGTDPGRIRVELIFRKAVDFLLEVQEYRRQGGNCAG